MLVVNMTIFEGYGRRFAEAGFAAFCPDARGFGERDNAAACARVYDDDDWRTQAESAAVSARASAGADNAVGEALARLDGEGK